MALRQHPQFDDGAGVLGRDETGGDAGLLEAVAQGGRVGVPADMGDEGDGHAERGEVQRDVGGTARPIEDTADLDDRHRRLRRDPPDRPFHVAIEHGVADEEDALCGEIAEEAMHRRCPGFCGPVSSPHSGVRSTGPMSPGKRRSR